MVKHRAFTKINSVNAAGRKAQFPVAEFRVSVRFHYGPGGHPARQPGPEFDWEGISPGNPVKTGN
jgi:hypothetical protein